MVMSRADRRQDRGPRAVEVFGPNAKAALDVLALVDFAWHDCTGETSPPDDVLEDVWEVGGGDLAEFVSAAHAAVIDFRDVRVWADTRRAARETR